MKKLLFIILIFFGFWIGSFVEAGSNENISGYAWSENIGWINFSGSNYGVNINSDGVFSGYAWSENIGWIDFGQGTQVDLDTGEVSGWARALSYGGGWDGWIKMRGADYGVSINTISKEFSGYAWSDMIIGWISFKGVNYGVKTIFPFVLPNNPPDKPVKDQETTWNNCIFAGKSIPTFYWTYSDPDGDEMKAFEIEVDGDSSFSAPKFNHLADLGATSTSYAMDITQDDDHDWIDDLDWNATYFWRVKVKDSRGSWSIWSGSQQFKTPKEAYPYSGFTWDPEEPNQKEVVIFTPQDISDDYDYLWIITEGIAVFTDNTTSISLQPHIKFESDSNKIKLKVAKDSYVCESQEYEITANLPLPEYKEASPTIWLRTVFSSLASLIHGFYIFWKF
ncbi:MAG: hypothetical protein ABH841_01550 [Candidatus Nealsonbacteria bacterium]